MAEEVEEISRAHGWYDCVDTRTFGEDCALLHSEVSEALEAWRKWSLADRTRNPELDDYGEMHHFKPEGVGSEYADIPIRLLATANRWDIELKESPGMFAVVPEFAGQINVLHLLICMMYWAHEDEWSIVDRTPGELGKVLKYLIQLSGGYGIDLEFEYKRKTAYNRTCPYRHGGKRL
jgi:NTP pyrophosphatase (non-canonical NTP hydrolase)